MDYKTIQDTKAGAIETIDLSNYSIVVRIIYFPFAMLLVARLPSFSFVFPSVPLSSSHPTASVLILGRNFPTLA